MPKPNAFRTIQMFRSPNGNAVPGPRKLIIDIYEDRYTPLDVMCAIATWLQDDPVAMASFTTFMDASGEDDDQVFTSEEAAAHVDFMQTMILSIWAAEDAHVTYVTGIDGWVN